MKMLATKIANVVRVPQFRHLLIASAFAFTIPAVSQATDAWTSSSNGGQCQSVIGITNDLADNNAIYITLSPGITACSLSTGSVGFVVGANGVTSGNINSLLATAMFAMATGQQVMVYFNTTGCTGQVIAVGGYQKQCP
jgi:hypothetical protein